MRRPVVCVSCGANLLTGKRPNINWERRHDGGYHPPRLCKNCPVSRAPARAP